MFHNQYNITNITITNAIIFALTLKHNLEKIRE